MGLSAARIAHCLLAVGLVAVAASFAGASSRLVGLVVDDPVTRDVVDRSTLARSLQPVRYLGTVQITDWLLDRPHLAAALARNLHPPLERYHIAMRDDGSFAVNDHGTLRGTLRLVAHGPNRRVYFCHGQFRSLAHILNFSGSMVVALDYREVPQAVSASVEVTPQLYVRIDNIFVHGVLKVVSPLIHGVIDRRVAHLAAATQVVGERISRDPRGLYREMRGWPDIRPEDLEAYRRAFVVEPAGS